MSDAGSVHLRRRRDRRVDRRHHRRGHVRHREDPGDACREGHRRGVRRRRPRSRRPKRAAPAPRSQPSPAPPAVRRALVGAAAGPQPAAASQPPASRPTVPPPAASGPGFPAVRRGGYDKEAVDARFRQLTTEKAGLSSSLTVSEKRVLELEGQLEEARKQVAENQNPSYAGLGGRASAMLRLAEEEAGDVRAAAERDAAEIRERANRDAQSIRAEATREAEDMRLVQLQELDETRKRMLADAEQERALAKAESDDLLASAKRESDQLRLAAQQETNDLRTTAKRESEQARAAADREVQEARRTLAVEKERLAKEATDHHSNATAETKRLVDEAEERAAAGRAARPRGAQPGDHPPPAGPEGVRGDADACPPRGRADRGLGPHPGRRDHLAGRRRVRAAAGRDQGRGRPDGQAPRRDRRPARLVARRRRWIRRGRELSDDPAADAPKGPTGRAAGRPAAEATDEAGSTAGTATDVQPAPAEPRHELGVPGKPLERHSAFYIGFFGGLGALLAYWLGTQLLAISSVLILVVVAMFLAVGLNPVVEFFVRRGLRRSYAVLSVIVMVVIALGLFVLAIVPVISDQVAAITENAPEWFDELQRNRQIQDLNEKYDVFDRAESYIEQGGFTSSLFGGVLGVGLAVLSTLLNAFIVVVLTLYFLSSLQSIKNALYRLAPHSRRDRVTKLGDRVLGSIGGYVSGAFIVATCAGLSSLIFLFVVGLGEYAVALAFVVALLDVIPMIGATIGAVIVSAIGFAVGPQDRPRVRDLLPRSTSRSRTTSSTRG